MGAPRNQSKQTKVVNVRVTQDKVFLAAPYRADFPSKARAIGGDFKRDSLVWVWDRAAEPLVRELCVSVFGTDNGAPTRDVPAASDRSTERQSRPRQGTAPSTNNAAPRSVDLSRVPSEALLRELLSRESGTRRRTTASSPMPPLPSEDDLPPEALRDEDEDECAEDPRSSGDGSPEPFCGCGRRHSECDGSRSACHATHH